MDEKKKVVASIEMSAEKDRVILSYRHRSDGKHWKHEEYPVLIEWTACHLGGVRPWFICPAGGCGRRVAILYSGAIFACRRCHQLAYASTREDAAYRATRRADQLRERLGWKPGIYNDPGPKPKWMRWRTFQRLTEEHDRLVGRSERAIAVKFGLTRGVAAYGADPAARESVRPKGFAVTMSLVVAGAVAK
jgi:hypothetical protein